MATWRASETRGDPREGAIRQPASTPKSRVTQAATRRQALVLRDGQAEGRTFAGSAAAWTFGANVAPAAADKAPADTAFPDKALADKVLADTRISGMTDILI
jgi:hypothetical protein